MTISRRILILLLVFPFADSVYADDPASVTTSVSAVDKAHKLYDEAEQLYSRGPQAADQVARKLEEAIELDPKYRDATVLLAITYFGQERFEQALGTLDDAIGLFRESGSLNSRLYFLKAKCLAAMNRADEARDLLYRMDALFRGTGDAEFEREVDALRDSLIVCTQHMVTTIGLAAVAEAIDLGFEASKYIIIVVNKNSHPVVLRDSDVGPYVPEIALADGHWAAVFVPENNKITGRFVVWFDCELKRSGYSVLGEPEAYQKDLSLAYQLEYGEAISDEGDIRVPMARISRVPAGERIPASNR